MTQARRPLAVAATSVAFVLAGAGAAYACDRDGSAGGDYPGTYPGSTTTESTSTTSSSSRTATAAQRKAARRAAARRAAAARS